MAAFLGLKHSPSTIYTTINTSDKNAFPKSATNMTTPERKKNENEHKKLYHLWETAVSKSLKGN